MPNGSSELARVTAIRETIAELTAFVEELIEDDYHEEASGVARAIALLKMRHGISDTSMTYFLDKAMSNRLHPKETT